MTENIRAVKASSSSLAVHADLLARMSQRRKATNSNQTHKLAWHDAAERMAEERRVAEQKLREALLAMREGALADEATELLREDMALERERADLAEGAAACRRGRHPGLAMAAGCSGAGAFGLERAHAAVRSKRCLVL